MQEQGQDYFFGDDVNFAEERVTKGSSISMGTLSNSRYRNLPREPA